MPRGVYNRTKPEEKTEPVDTMTPEALQVKALQEEKTEPVDTMTPEALQVKALQAENDALKRRVNELQTGKGIPAAKIEGETLKRPEQWMAEALTSALGKDAEDLTEQEIIAIEREIRRFVKRGGTRLDRKGDDIPVKPGFVSGIRDEEKAYATALLKKLGRDKPEWDTSIIVPGFYNV